MHDVRPLGSMRFIGLVLFMLLLSLFELVSPGPAAAMQAARAGHERIAVQFLSHDSTGSTDVESDPAVNTGYRGGMRIPGDRLDGSVSGLLKSTTATTSVGRTSSVSSAVLNRNHISFFYRLRPKIFMIPRMNRTPKPKSVYRLFARAPGKHLLP